MSKKTGNKAMLEKVNYSINIIKDIKEGKEFTKEEKQKIITNYCSTEENNNGYYTPIEICKFMSDCLDIKGDSKVADLSAGIGNMTVPLITEYGKLKDNITFDLYEFDENTSLALEKTWEDYEQVNVIGNVDTLSLDIENKYDYIIGNPPFTLKTDYKASWNVDKKGKQKVGLNILEAFIDKSMIALKENGVMALVVAMGISFKGNATALLRNHLSSNYNLKLVMELNNEVFESAGLAGTGVSTLLLIIEKNKTTDNKTIIAELDKEDFIGQLNSLSYYYKLVQKDHHIQYTSNNDNLLYGLLKEGLDPMLIGEDDEYEEDKDIIGKCYCCDKEIEEYQLASGEFKLKSTDEEVLVCFECINDSYMYYKKIIPNLILDGESYELSKNDKKTLENLEKEKEIREKQEKEISYEKTVYILSNDKRRMTISECQNHQQLEMVKQFQNCTEDNIVRIKFPKIINISKIFENQIGLDYIKITVDDLKIEHYKSRAVGEKEWTDNQRHIYHGTIQTSVDLYDTTFGIFYYPKNNRCSVYVNYDYNCSKSSGLKKLIKENIVHELIKTNNIEFY